MKEQDFETVYHAVSQESLVKAIQKSNQSTRREIVEKLRELL